MSFEFFERESPATLRPDESALDPGDVSAPWFRGMTHELYAAPARFGVNAARAVSLAAGAVNTPIDYVLGTDLADQAFAAVPKLTAARQALTLDHDDIGVAARTLGAVGEFVTGLVAGVGNPALVVGTQQLNTALELSDKGVRPAVAVGAATTEAVATALAFQIPAFGSTGARRIALGALGGAAEGAVTRGSVETILEQTGYAKQAADYDVWNGEALAVDFLAGALFGGLYHATAGRAGDAARAALEAERRAPPQDPPEEVVDAVLAANDHAHRVASTAPGQPADGLALDKHARAIEDALTSVFRDEPVTASVAPELFVPDARRAAQAIEREAAAVAELGHAAVDAPVSPWIVDGMPLWLMGSDDLRALADREAAQSAQTLTNVFGSVDAANRFLRYSRSEQPATFAKGEAMLEALTPEQRAAVEAWEAGTDSTLPGRLTDTTLTELSEAVELIRASDESVEQLARALAPALARLGKPTEPEAMTPEQMKAFLQLREAMDVASRQGWDRDAVSKAAIEQAAARVGDPLDAEFMLERFLEPERPAVRAPAQDVAALPAPVRPAPAEPGPTADAPAAGEVRADEPAGATPAGRPDVTDTVVADDGDLSASPTLAQAVDIAAARADLTITRDDGTEVSAAEALAEADAALREAEALAPGIDALVACAAAHLGEAA